MNIIEFLLERIAEDEREARVCLDQYERGEGGSSRRWRRTLAECEAKRRIVEREMNSTTPITYRRSFVLRDLASVYADHPDYDGAWKP